MIGYMTLWAVNLDAISMITIIMSIGFAVDLTAHISYACVYLLKNVLSLTFYIFILLKRFY